MDDNTWLKYAAAIAELRGEVFFWKFMSVAMAVIALAMALWGASR